MDNENQIVYKLRDGKKKLMLMFTGSVVTIASGIAILIDAVFHPDPTVIAIGAVLTIIGIVLLYNTNKEVDEKIHNFTSGFFGSPA